MVSVDPRFEAADDLSVSEISQYRSFFFPPSVCEPTGEIFFSVDNAPEWMTSRGYRLFQEHDPTKPPDRLFHPDRVSLKDLRGYREQVIGPAYSKNPFFGFERTKEWVLPAPFATYMQAVIKQNKICMDVHVNDLQKPSGLHPSGLVISLSFSLSLPPSFQGIIPLSVACKICHPISFSIAPKI
ncbi:hypothetical protein B0H14DRAFT_3489652 [Mycena olivaceomarginata]|nr:hypothetical protein B0H14DRAFT_3489652 [Mycena olivaceomarginata]